MTRGAGRIFVRGPKWWIAYYAPVDGRAREIRESAGATEAEAHRLLERRLREVANHRDGLRRFVGPRGEQTTFRQLAADLVDDAEVRGLKSLRTIRIHLRRPLEAFGTRRAATMTAETLKRYARQRLSDGASRATVDRELELVTRAFRLGKEAGKVAFELGAARLQKLHGNARRGFLNRDEFDGILAGVRDEDFRDFLEWLWWTGMRPGEAASLEWGSYDRRAGVLRLEAADAKIGVGRTVPIVSPLVPVIASRLRRRTPACRLIFHSRGRSLVLHKGGLRDRLYDDWFRACRAAGLPGLESPRALRVIPYDLRRTATRNLIAAGVSQRDAMEITGHKTTSTFHRYQIVDVSNTRAALERVADYVSRTRTRTNGGNS